MTGPYHVAYWFLISCNIIAPQALWFKNIRSNPVTAVYLVDHGADRHVAGALRDYREQPGAGFLPSSWGIFQATRWDWATYVGTIGLFLFLFFLFIRLLPMISIFEVRTLAAAGQSGGGGGAID